MSVHLPGGSATLPLAGYAVLRSRDLKETTRFLASCMPSHTLDPLAAMDGVQGYANRVTLGRLSLSVTGIGIPVAVHAKVAEDVYLIHVPLVGQFQASVNDFLVHAAESAGFILSPGSEMHLNMTEGAVGLQVQVPADLLRARLASLLSGSITETLVFAPSMPKNAPYTNIFLSQLNHVVASVELGALDTPLLISETVNNLVSLLLLTHASNCSQWLGRSSHQMPRYVRRVEVFMRENLQRSLSIKDLTAIGGVSERTLHNAYADHFGTSPMRRLKMMRLHAVRRRLMEHAPIGITVTAAAMEFGFFQLGRFSAEYHDAFGELPSETLRRHHSLSP